MISNIKYIIIGSQFLLISSLIIVWIVGQLNTQEWFIGFLIGWFGHLANNIFWNWLDKK